MADEHDDIEVTSDTTIAVAPVKKKLKLDKPPDSCVKTAYHPSGPKFLNTKLWKNFKLVYGRPNTTNGVCALFVKRKKGLRGYPELMALLQR